MYNFVAILEVAMTCMSVNNIIFSYKKLVSHIIILIIIIIIIIMFVAIATGKGRANDDH